MSVYSVEQSARGRVLGIGRFTFYAGRMDWNRETRVSRGRGFAGVSVLGRYAGVAWR